ncbi:MAG: hypothetical protein ACK5LZ_04275 [Anaerorhabdus sp.]
MIENINDFMTIASLAVIILASFYGAYRIFVQHHENRMQQLESEYYQSDSDSDD